MLPSNKVAFDFSNEKLIGTYLLLPLITFARDKCLPTGMALAVFFAGSTLSQAHWFRRRKGAILAEHLKRLKHQMGEEYITFFFFFFASGSPSISIHLSEKLSQKHLGRAWTRILNLWPEDLERPEEILKERPLSPVCRHNKHAPPTDTEPLSYRVDAIGINKV